ncbi:NmrA family NAD(P)-binding protein [Parahaliea mediterranea]|uniref:NmrA family NAD(P)-binding protein n=1 Tax=Parahaliea mediterranea TaxID=651086 RepID=UPI000E2FB0DA|nr:NmrA family NAD(P)-binding protein [Parahaliea mediterranea]
MKKTVTVFSATGVAGKACVDELIRQGHFRIKVLSRKQGQQEKSSFRPTRGDKEKQLLLDAWHKQGVEIVPADVTDHADLIPALRGTDYLVSCAPMLATEAQYALIWAAKEAGVERFVPSEYGFIYEWEQFWPTDTIHRTIARQKVFVRRVIELAGLDYTIIPAGLWPEFYLAEPVQVMGDGEQKIAWSCGEDVGRIIPHILAHPDSRNAVCPVAATAYCSWNALLNEGEKALGRRIERHYLDSAAWKAAYEQEQDRATKMHLAIGVAATECPEGMPLWANWNKLHLPDFQGTSMPSFFSEVMKTFVEDMRREST